jgi:hypothetical protein
MEKPMQKTRTQLTSFELFPPLLTRDYFATECPPATASAVSTEKYVGATVREIAHIPLAVRHTLAACSVLMAVSVIASAQTHANAPASQINKVSVDYAHQELAKGPVSPKTQAINYQFSVGRQPYGLAFDGAYIWVANGGSNIYSLFQLGCVHAIRTIWV